MNQSVATPSPLVEIDVEQYQVQIEMIYATADNLAGKIIYPTARCQLHRDAAVCLRKASQMTSVATTVLAQKPTSRLAAVAWN